MIEIFSTPMVIIYAILYGITMKVADLLDEHGLKWFRGVDILFGVLWGGFGALLIFSHPIIANLVLANTIAFLLRNRLDYFNHQLAASITIIAFIIAGVFQPVIFIIFGLIFYIFGSIKDYSYEKKKKGKVYTFFKFTLYSPIATLIYSLITNDWIVFITWTLAVIVYDIVKHLAKNKGYK